MSVRHNLLLDFYQDVSRFGLDRTEELVQLALIAFALFLGWLLSRTFKTQPLGEQKSMPTRIGREGLIRVLFPLGALAVTLRGGKLLRRWFGPQLTLLDLANVLLMALLSIRLLVYLLGHRERQRANP